MLELALTLRMDGDLSAAPGEYDAASSQSLSFYMPRPCKGNPVSFELFIVVPVLPAPAYIFNH